MPCPKCGAKSRVVKSRDTLKAFIRRRECLECKERFTTEELWYDALHACPVGTPSEVIRSYYRRSAGARCRDRRCVCKLGFTTWETVITDRGSGFVRQATWEAKNAENAIKHLKMRLSGFEKREQERLQKKMEDSNDV